MLSQSQLFLEELEMEAPLTRNTILKIPMDNGAWQPHIKSFAIGHLARHVAEIPGWMQLMLEADELDFAAMKYTPPVVDTNEQLVKLYDDNIEIAKQQLKKADNSKFNEPWTMRHGDQVYFTMPRHQVIRKWVFSHIVHHRAQLGVYLRLMDIPVPSVYGPSADDTGS